MKTTHLLATLIAATLPLTAVFAEDTAKPAAADQTKEEGSQGMGMMDENDGHDDGNENGTNDVHDVQLEGSGRRTRQTRRRNE